MGKSSATPPPPPDPTVTANAQSAANIATAQEQQRLNMINTSGPNGSVTYQSDANAPGGYSQTTTLSPGQQGIYDQGVQAQLGALGLANGQIGRIGQALGQGLNPMTGGLSGGGGYSSAGGGGKGAGSALPAPEAVMSGGSAGTFGMGAKSGLQAGMTSNGGASVAPSVQNNFGMGPGVQYNVAQGPGIQTGFDTGPGVQYSYANGGDVQKGVGAGDFNASMQNAANAVYGQATSRLDPQWQLAQKQESQRLADQGLSANSAAYQNEMDTFNRAKNDAYNQANMSAVQAGQGVQQQGYGQALSSGQFANAAQLQAEQENAARAQFYNQASGQTFDQNQAAAQFNNAAAGQQFGQNLSGQQAYNAAVGQNYNQNLGAAQFNNQGIGQAFQQNSYAQELPINEFTALMGSGQVSMPTGVSYSPTQVGQTDVLGSYALNSQVAQNNYNQQMANNRSMLGGMASLGGAAIMASDARLKEDIRYHGRLPSGVGVYAYRYKGDPEERLGVMAQEVALTRPDAVHVHPSGFLMVDYGALL